MHYALAVVSILALLIIYYFFGADISQSPKQQAVSTDSPQTIVDLPQSNSPPNTQVVVDKQLVNQVRPVIPPLQTLSPDQLLDEQDKTERNKVIINSHVNLLNVITEFRALHKAKLKAPGHQKLVSWTQALIQSVYVRNELGMGNIPAIDWDDLQVLMPDLIPETPSPLAYISPGELKGLNMLVKEVSSLTENTLTEQKAWSLGIRLAELARDSKDYSDGYYIEQMRTYLLSNEYSVGQKITFARYFVIAKDWKLAKFAYQFFQQDPQLSKNQTHKAEIQALLNEIKQGLESQ